MNVVQVICDRKFIESAAFVQICGDIRGIHTRIFPYGAPYFFGLYISQRNIVGFWAITFH